MRLRAPGLGVLLVLAACGSSAETKSSDAGVDGGPAITGSQMVLLAQNTPWFSQALFMNGQAHEGERCAPKQVGSCLLFSCHDESGRLGNPTRVARAGRVIITGGSGGDASLDPNGDGTFSPLPLPADTFTAGDRLTFSLVAGADLPAAEVTLTVPERLAGLQPSDPLEIDRSKPFEVHWEPLAGAVWVMLSQAGNDVWLGNQLACEFDGEAGTGSVPPEVLASLDVLDPQEGWMQGWGAFRAESKDLVLAGYPIKVLAWSGPNYRTFTAK